MQNIYKQIKRIIYVAYIGMLSKPEKSFVPRKSNLNSNTYETKRIIYKAHPINRKVDFSKTRGRKKPCVYEKMNFFDEN